MEAEVKAGSLTGTEFPGGSISSHVGPATGSVGWSLSYLQKHEACAAEMYFVCAIA